MIQSPCRNCPNRFKDKRFCMENCVLLHRVQAFAVGRRKPEPFSAVDMADDNRYRLMAGTDIHKAGANIHGLF